MLQAPAWTDPAGFAGTDVLGLPSGSLDLGQRAHLAELAERVRLAHDLLLALGDRWAVLPIRFAGAQAREAALLTALLHRYVPAHPDSARPPGSFAAPAAQGDYDRLLARGRTGRAEAAEAVAEALRRVLTLLDTDLPRMSAPDVHVSYARLYAATIRQLQAVQVWSPR